MKLSLFLKLIILVLWSVQSPAQEITIGIIKKLSSPLENQLSDLSPTTRSLLGVKKLNNIFCDTLTVVMKLITKQGVL